MKTLLKSRRSTNQRVKTETSRPILAYAAVLVLAVSLVGLVPAGAATTPPDTVRAVRFGEHIGYERAVIDLGSRQEAADLAPSYRSSYTDGDWVARISLPTTRHTLTTGAAGPGGVISRYHVVRSQRGSLSVYFHLKEAASSVSVFRLNHPARVVIDVSGGGTALYAKPVMGVNTVILRPLAHRPVGPGTFMVRGYGRPFEGKGTWRVKDVSGRLVEQGTYTTSDWATTWGAFAFGMPYPQKLAGTQGTLEVGQYSPRGGHFQGVSVPLSFR